MFLLFLGQIWGTAVVDVPTLPPNTKSVFSATKDFFTNLRREVKGFFDPQGYVEGLRASYKNIPSTQRPATSPCFNYYNGRIVFRMSFQWVLDDLEKWNSVAGAEFRQNERRRYAGAHDTRALVRAELSHLYPLLEEKSDTQKLPKAILDYINALKTWLEKQPADQKSKPNDLSEELLAIIPPEELDPPGWCHWPQGLRWEIQDKDGAYNRTEEQIFADLELMVLILRLDYFCRLGGKEKHVKHYLGLIRNALDRNKITATMSMLELWYTQNYAAFEKYNNCMGWGDWATIGSRVDYPALTRVCYINRAVWVMWLTTVGLLVTTVIATEPDFDPLRHPSQLSLDTCGPGRWHRGRSSEISCNLSRETPEEFALRLFGMTPHDPRFHEAFERECLKSNNGEEWGLGPRAVKACREFWDMVERTGKAPKAARRGFHVLSAEQYEALARLTNPQRAPGTTRCQRLNDALGWIKANVKPGQQCTIRMGDSPSGSDPVVVASFYCKPFSGKVDSKGEIMPGCSLLSGRWKGNIPPGGVVMVNDGETTAVSYAQANHVKATTKPTTAAPTTPKPTTPPPTTAKPTTAQPTTTPPPTTKIPHKKTTDTATQTDEATATHSATADSTASTSLSDEATMSTSLRPPVRYDNSTGAPFSCQRPSWFTTALTNLRGTPTGCLCDNPATSFTAAGLFNQIFSTLLDAYYYLGALNNTVLTWTNLYSRVDKLAPVALYRLNQTIFDQCFPFATGTELALCQNTVAAITQVTCTRTNTILQGLYNQWDTLQKIGEVTLVCPKGDYSATGVENDYCTNGGYLGTTGFKVMSVSSLFVLEYQLTKQLTTPSGLAVTGTQWPRLTQWSFWQAALGYNLTRINQTCSHICPEPQICFPAFLAPLESFVTNLFIPMSYFWAYIPEYEALIKTNPNCRF